MYGGREGNPGVPVLRLALLAGLAAALTAAPAAAADAASGGGNVVVDARGVGDVVDPGDGDDGTDTAGSAQTPSTPGLLDLLLVGPAVALLVLGAWAANPLRDRDDEPETGEGSPDPGGTPSPDGTDGDPQSPVPGNPQGDQGADEGHPPAVGGLPTGSALPGPDDVSDVEPGVPRILRLGKEAVDEGDLEAAVEWFETALAADPDLGVAHLCRGLSLEEMGRHDEAAGAFRQAAEADPGDVAARYLLARNLAESGSGREALVHLRQVLDLVPELADLARDDEGFRTLRDDPRFLAALGDL